MDYLQNFSDVMFYVAIISTVLFVLKVVVFYFTGGDSEVISDFNTEFDSDISFNFISIQSLLAFFMGFGWMGLTCVKQFELTVLMSSVYAVLFGVFLMLLSSYLFFVSKKLNKKIVINFSKSIGTIGKAYSSFEPKSSGQIEIVINEKLTVLPAFNNSDEEIKAFEQIKVVDYKNNVLYIERN